MLLFDSPLMRRNAGLFGRRFHAKPVRQEAADVRRRGDRIGIGAAAKIRLKKEIQLRRVLPKKIAGVRNRTSAILRTKTTRRSAARRVRSSETL
jgi:hypothetical protein